ncbi:hypothetical protein BST81_15875 [Leptolyngbya sp. 'hensonii']|uniref:damage-control phosphatase ARMT1 family protein n=1 Tax=Leptolyngbya sp. 'hensonii' TaxID=1922337 RepID=UPI00094F76D8|nr:damage-control phosphatase ARMT1 family protein [Leptolyngbya sp. 'hensonii']OLP17470.1 hypothetical protein BST81_15875 [Leptolyngbya sp. 'hensonii']
MQPPSLSLPLPPPLRMSEPGSFAHHTLTHRWPTIAHRVIPENNFSSEIGARLIALTEDLSRGRVRPLQDQAPDTAAWRSYLQPWLGKPWLELPWFFAEVYFYRRLLEATRYFEPEEGQGIDPFRSQKQAALHTALVDIQGMGDSWNDLIYSSLWGNRADLSLRPETTVPAFLGQTMHQNRILVDDTPALQAILLDRSHARLDWIADNAGFELICDLLLIDLLLRDAIAQTVHLHLKSHPTFVSDATIGDLHHTLTALAADVATRSVAERLQGFLEQGQLRLVADPFWTAPLVFWEMPANLHQDLSQSNLVVIKGDANYRRLLGDRHWPFTTPLADILAYFPTSLVALRILKSEIVVGLDSEQLRTLPQKDQSWLVNGKWGLIQGYFC